MGRLASQHGKVPRVWFLLVAIIGLFLLLQFVSHPASWMSLRSSYDHLTEGQLAMARNLRRAMKRSNIESLSKEDMPEIAELFTYSKELRRFSSMNGSEFHAALTASEPLIISGSDISCTKNEWTLDFIRRVAGNDVVGVETSKSNRFYSNEGLRKESMRIADFLDKFRSPSRDKDYYLAEENIEEMPELAADVVEPSFAEYGSLDRTQIWVGAGGQVSPLHHDQWENVLCQMQGTRKFTLYDPLQVDRLYPKTGVNRHFSYIDPEHPDLAKFPRYADAVKYEVTLKAGEIMIIPAYWWHQVHHANEVNVGLNFWYTPQSILSELLYDTLLPP